MFLGRLGARRQVGLLLRNGPSALNFHTMFEVPSFPHGDTLNKVFRRLDPEEIQQVVCGMTEKLLRNKLLYTYRLLDRWFVVAIDGTGTLTFHNRHCPHCLTQTHNGKTVYYHTVLEAKIVTPNGFSFSLMSEFIENPGENPTKQDCELKAFYRLAKRLHERFPRLPILLSLDSLFACGPVFALCRQYGWSFMIVLKDEALPSVHEEFMALGRLEPHNKLTWRTGKGAKIKQQFRWVNDISYVDSDRREHTVSVVECIETKPDPNNEAGQTRTRFLWVTDCKISSDNVIAMANEGGRIRWKVENEGFNVQKKGGYALEHGYSNNVESGKVFYYLLQIAHLVAQLLEKGSLLKHAFPAGFGSLKNVGFRLLEAWRNAWLPPQALQEALGARIQIRFDSS